MAIHSHRYIYSLILLFTFLFYGFQETYAQQTPETVRLMTFNIRYNEPNDGEDAWPHRKDHVVSMIRFHKADIIGVQEALKGQLDYLAEKLTEYAWFGVGRDDGKEAGEFTAIFYRKTQFKLISQATFWLSETPEKPSVGWDAALNRTATWGKFIDNVTEKTFFVFNTHFDHRGENARTQSAKLLVKKANEIAADAPAFIIGDFNVTPETEAYAVLNDGNAASGKKFRDARYLSETPHHGPEGTFTGFKLAELREEPIDFIFAESNCKVLFHGVLLDTFNGRLPSDHLPVLIEVALKSTNIEK